MRILHSREALTEQWRIDGDIDAKIIRISDTGAAETPYYLINPLGRLPVGVQIIKKNKACDVYLITETFETLTLKFTVANCDLTLRVW